MALGNNGSELREAEDTEDTNFHDEKKRLRNSTVQIMTREAASRVQVVCIASMEEVVCVAYKSMETLVSAS